MSKLNGEILKIRNQDLPHNIVFMEKEKEVGRLEWHHGKMTFKGNMDEATRVFFTELQHMFNSDRA